MPLKTIMRTLAVACVATWPAVVAAPAGPSVADPPAAGTVLAWPAGLPVYDHVVIVVEENKDYKEIIGSADAPYINGVLVAEGANLTRMYGEEHVSQGNYFWLFSGSNQTVGFDDRIPSEETHPGAYPFQTSNLGQQLIKKGRSFKGYAEGLHSIGFTDEFSPDELYARKHVPWISFGNVPNGKTVADSCNLRFDDFPTDFTQLPTVAFVIPNLENDMHNKVPDGPVRHGDTWLKEHLNVYYQWAKTHNSLLILTFDENNDRKRYKGLTNPLIDKPQDEFQSDLQNRIVTIFAGAHIKHGEYPEGKGVTHVNVLRTLEAMYGLPKSGAQQPNAAGGGISDNYVIKDLFQ
jgi:acid phosphatase